VSCQRAHQALGLGLGHAALVLLDSGGRLGERRGALGVAGLFCNRWATDGIRLMFGWHGIERRLSVICGMICLAVAGSALHAENTFDGVYTGQRVLTKGSSPPCLVKEDVSVTISDGALSFTNSALQNFGMGFDPAPDGSFSEMYNDVGGGDVVFRGHITGDTIEADVTNYATACEYHWHLKKDHQGQ
jgi:hypothetical protein